MTLSVLSWPNSPLVDHILSDQTNKGPLTVIRIHLELAGAQLCRTGQSHEPERLFRQLETDLSAWYVICAWVCVYENKQKISMCAKTVNSPLLVTKNTPYSFMASSLCKPMS